MIEIVTSKSIEAEKRDREDKESKRIIEELDIEKDIDINLDIFIEGYKHELDVYNNTLNEVSKRKKELQHEKKKDLITDTILKAEIEKLHTKIELQRERANKNIDELGTKLKSIYKERGKVSSKNINDDDIKLLKSGIELTYDELRELIDKYNATNNQTMLRIIKRYADDNNIAISINQVDEPLLAIDTFINFTKQGINNESEYWTRSIKPEHRGFLIDNLKKSLGQD